MAQPMNDAEFIMRFSNNAQTMVAMKALKAVGLKPRLITRHHDLKTESDLCLAVESMFEDDAKRALAASKISMHETS